MGYAQRLMRGNIAIYYDGPGDTVCVEVSGQGCRQIEAEKGFTSGQDWQEFFRELVEADCGFPRVDWAIDDCNGILDVSTVINNVRAGLCASRLRKIQHHTILRSSDGQEVGWWASFGSRTSELCVRIYDKRMEASIKDSPPNWVRVEVETKNKQALALVKAFIVAGPVAIRRDLSARISFKEARSERKDTNKSRWPTCAWWLRFLGNCDQAIVTIAPAIATLDDIARNIETQWAPNLALLMTSPRFGQPWFEGLLVRGEMRWDERHLTLLGKA